MLYVEGPRDRDILRAWAWRSGSDLGRVLARCSVILGGRQPDRAVGHFRQVRAAEPEARGLCVLDRDHESRSTALPDPHPGLEFFVWSRRHIESYLLVPDAIRRSLRLRANDSRIARICETILPARGEEDGFRTLDAKRLLGREGEIARAIGQPLRSGEIARAMRDSDLHPDIHRFFERMKAALRADGGPQ